MKKLIKRIASTHLKAIQACPPDESEPQKSLAILFKRLSKKAFEAGRLYEDSNKNSPSFEKWFNRNFS